MAGDPDNRTDSDADCGPCLACGSTQTRIAAHWSDWEAACGARADGEARLAWAQMCGVAADAPSLVECSVCGAVSMDPPPRADQLVMFYTNYHGVDAYLAKADKKVMRAMRRLAPFRLLLGRGKSLLEVGASIGAAAEAGRRLGFEAHAQEIDPYAIKKGRARFGDVHFIEGELAAARAHGPFDVVHCAEVIEHARDPRQFAHDLAAVTRPGGRLFLTTPDAGHPRRGPLMAWGSVKPPEHVTLFTKRALSIVLRAAGFDQLRFFPYAKPGVRMIARRLINAV